MNDCNELGLPEPVYEYKASYFSITFTKNLNEGIMLLIEIIKKNPGKRTNNLASILERPNKTIERWISTLKKEGYIEYKGSKKTGVC